MNDEILSETNYELDRVVKALQQLVALQSLMVLMHYKEHGGDVGPFIIDQWIEEIQLTATAVRRSARR